MCLTVEGENMIKAIWKKIKSVCNFYDDKNLEKEMEDSMLMLRDVQIRVRDVQDRAYDLLWQIKTQKKQRDIMFWQLYKKAGESLQEAQLRFFHELPIATGNIRKSQLILSKLLKLVCDTCEMNNLSYWLDFGTLLGAVRHNGFIPWDDDIDLGMMRKDAERLYSILEKDDRVNVRRVFLNYDGNGIIRVFQVRVIEAEFEADLLGSTLSSVDIFEYDFCESFSLENWFYFMDEKKIFVRQSENIIKVGLPFVFDSNTQQILGREYEKKYLDIRKRLKITLERAPYIVFGFNNFYYKNYCDAHMFSEDKIFPLKRLSFEGIDLCVPNKYMDYISNMYEDIFSLPTDMLSHQHTVIKERDLIFLDILFNKYCESDNG